MPPTTSNASPDDAMGLPALAWLDILPEAILVCDAAGRVLALNREAERILAYAGDDLIGHPLDRIVPRETTGVSETALRRFAQRPTEQAGGEPLMIKALRGDGSSVHLQLRVGKLGSVGGASAYAISLRDQSDDVATERRLRALNDQLASVAGRWAARTLAADLMHELNQPLAALANYMEACRVLMARQEMADPRLEEMLHAAQRQAGRASEIVRHLRRFGMREEPDLKRVAVERCVRDAVKLVMAGRSHANIRCTFAFDPAARFMVADEAQVQQVLVQLLSHMVEVLESQTPADRQLLIKTRRDAEQVAIMLSDNGPGLTDQAIRTLYEPFIAFQTDPDITLGLMMSRRIVEDHGGRLTGENRSEGGACFAFHLPADPDRDA